MQLMVLGGDLRMNGLLRAARRAGFICRYAVTKEELEAHEEHVTAVALPWPVSFPGGFLAQTEISREQVMASLPACDYLMGGKLDKADFPMAKRIVDPSEDEELLSVNARLTAEGAIAALLASEKDALMGRTCLITGFGRIAQALVRRLSAMEMFVTVCARNEQQMQLAHRLGAHPVPLRQLPVVSAQADIVLNTIPARVFACDALSQMKPGARYIELASAPYGAEPEQAAKLGVNMEIMGGIPGKYAPERAGEALFGVLDRAMKGDQTEGGAK